MLKIFRSAFLAVVALFILLGPNLTPPIDYGIYVQYEIVPDQDSVPGGGVKLFWEAPYSPPGETYSAGCKQGPTFTAEITDWQYLIVIDDVAVDTIDQLENIWDENIYYVYTPCATIEIYPYFEGRSYEDYAERLEFDYREEEGFELWIREDFDYEYSDFPSGISFAFDGDPDAYYVSYEGHWHTIDFYVDTNFVLHASSDHDPPLNDRQSYISKADEDSWDTMDIAQGFTEESYQLSTLLEEGGLYFLFLEPRRLGANDDGLTYYAKMEVTEIEGEKITLRTTLQAEPGFRWLTGDLPTE